MSFRVVIPARWDSTRLPGKPLADVAGVPMILRVLEQARSSDASEVVVATDDARVADVVRDAGGEVEITDRDHPSGTDRVQEVAVRRGWGAEEIVVNVQGDEPLIPPSVVNQVAGNLAARPDLSMATLAEAVSSTEEMFDPAVVKVVLSEEGLALYFSRAPIPWDRDRFADDAARQVPALALRHLGIYAYRVGILSRFVTWAPAPLEAIEKLEQLRVLHHGERIHVDVACAAVPGGIDTPDDLARINALLEREGAGR